MSKVIKQMEMDALKVTFQGVRDAVVLSTKGLSCMADYTFRAQLRKKDIRLKVVKNSLARKVFEELGVNLPGSSPYWAGNTVFAFGQGSIAEVSRAVDAELKGPKTAALYRDKVFVKGAIADGQQVAFDLALKMPTRIEAIARVIGMALSPASNLVSALTGPAASLASQIKTISEKKDETPAETPAATPA